MKTLLDTHTLLWCFLDSPRLSSKAKKIYLDTHYELYFSAASFWELSIKHSLGKLDLAPNWFTLIKKHLHENSICWLDISPEHCHQVSTLPFYHRDPFDRLLVAQALIENFSFMTADTQMSKYGVKCIW